MARFPAPIGWPLLPLPDPESGRIVWPGLSQSVQDSIRVILQTRPGEQLMNPEFGAGLQDFVGQPDTLVTRRRIRDRVAESLARWERRILVESVEVLDDSVQAGWVRVEIRFRLRRTGEPSRLGLTIALENA